MTNNITAPERPTEVYVMINEGKQAHQIAEECGTRIDRLQAFVPWEAAMETGRALETAQARIAELEEVVQNVERYASANPPLKHLQHIIGAAQGGE